jgi:hypothetical protein
MQVCNVLHDTEVVVSVASPADACVLVRLYARVYHGTYPDPNLFTEEGMSSFLNYDVSRALTFKVTMEGEIIAACTFQLTGRAAYCRGFMVDPAWQGRIHAKQVFDEVLLDARDYLAADADYFYGELRTAAPKVQAIAEGVNMVPMAILPRKDIFHGQRESEIIYAWHYEEPDIGPLAMTPKAAAVASAVLGYRVAAQISPIPPILGEESDDTLSENYTVADAGEGSLTINSSGGHLDAHVCPISREVEHVTVKCESDNAFAHLTRAFLGEVRRHDLEYAEVYVSAAKVNRQAILESLGFAPTGFLLHWYAPGAETSQDCVLYTISFPSSLPDCPMALTAKGEILRQRLGAEGLLPCYASSVKKFTAGSRATAAGEPEPAE